MNKSTDFLEIKDCKTVEEFADKYRKHERYKGRGEEYVKAILKSHYDEINTVGYTTISKHDNITGKFITFTP